MYATSGSSSHLFAIRIKLPLGHTVLPRNISWSKVLLRDKFFHNFKLMIHTCTREQSWFVAQPRCSLCMSGCCILSSPCRRTCTALPRRTSCSPCMARHDNSFLSHQGRPVKGGRILTLCPVFILINGYLSTLVFALLLKNCVANRCGHIVEGNEPVPKKIE